MNNRIAVNEIEEIYPGHYFSILDFPIKEDLYDIISLSHKYVWGFDQLQNSIQCNIISPYYLNLERLNGKRRYNLLREKADYLFKLEMPNDTGYAQIISPNKDFLISIIEKLTIQSSDVVVR